MAEKKPRICEILDVEVDEIWSFTIDGNEWKFKISKYRNAFNLYTKNPAKRNAPWVDATGMFISSIIIEIIENADKIKRESGWTEQDREAARILMYILPGVHTIKRTDLGRLIACRNTLGETVISHDLFPTLKAGESAMLVEILGSDET